MIPSKRKRKANKTLLKKPLTKKKRKKTHYVVIVGRIPGIYTSWMVCKEQTDGYQSAIFKGFYSLKDAEKWRDENQVDRVNETEFEGVIYISKDDTWGTTPLDKNDMVYVSLDLIRERLSIEDYQESFLNEFEIL